MPLNRQQGVQIQSKAGERQYQGKWKSGRSKKKKVSKGQCNQSSVQYIGKRWRQRNIGTWGKKRQVNHKTDS